MKKNLWSLFILAFAFAFTACSDDDKMEFIGDELDGVYKGALNVKVNGEAFGGEITQKVYITKIGENKIKMELKNFSIVGLTIGDIIVNDIDVVKSGDNNSFTGSEKIDLVVGECEVDVVGIINGSTLDMDIAVAVADGMEVDVDFNGKKMTADQSSEAKLMSFTFDTTNVNNKIITEQPVINGENTTSYSFFVTDSATPEQIKALVPTITVSENASVTPDVVDFTAPVTYTVTSEDGINKTVYTVKCISDAAKITKFFFDGSVNNKGKIAEQPVINGTNISFLISNTATAEDIKKLKPTVRIPKGSTVSPKSSTEQDFTKPVKYTVTSADSLQTTEYMVTGIVESVATLFSFDEWEWYSESYKKPKIGYYNLLPMYTYGTSNSGSYMAMAIGAQVTGKIPDELGNVTPSDDMVGATGKSAKLVTFDTRAGNSLTGMIPMVTSASVFTGKFELALENPLKSTKFGIKFDKKPLRFKGNYKYTSGAEFIDGSKEGAGDIIPNKKDEPSIIAVLYQVANWDETLTGVDINATPKSPMVVAEARLTDGSEKTEYTAFDITFDYVSGKTYDPSKKYKLAIVCSSSKWGDSYKGAPGSTLFIDEFEIVCE